MARRPTTRETLSGTKDNTGNTALTQSISRWLQLKHIEEWNQRQKNKGKKQRLRPATPDHQGPEMMEEPYLLPAKAGTDLRNLPGGFPNCGSYFSTETPREPMMSPYDQYYNDQQGTVFPALRENNHQRNDEPFRESHPPFGYNPHGLLANEAYPPAFHYQTTAWSVGDHTQTQYYNDQMFLAQDTPSAYQVPSYSSISNNTQYGLFDSGEDFYTDETQLHLQNTRYLLESPPALGVVDPNFMELMHGQTPRALEKSPIG